ncbi:nucleoside ABC transporter membrane protein [Faunimonas pinastri]|uniref:Nucleoside ABC transporter membrane protein n=1 Tax=Faunimonas pinastri TaxID=1855383 RepID=A0A1H9HJQ6_9HYPH|nr:ABC transporter permease [Faunimonas pinastri]SEQ62554.1 nucleoside ABC transporter membrane protein [Faunimonas pinastri]
MSSPIPAGPDRKASGDGISAATAEKPKALARPAPDKLPAWADYALLPLINVVAAFVVSGLAVLMVGANPLEAVKIMVFGALGYGEGVGFTLFYTTNFIFAGLAVAVAYHSGLFNIGAEGQAYVGGLGATFVALALDHFLPWYATVPIALVAACVFGAAWAFIPAWLQARRGSHIVITTIMFNFLANALMVWLLVNYFIQPGTMDPASRPFTEGASIPKLGGLFSLFGADLGAAPLNLCIFLALIAAVFVYVLIWRTKLGYEMRTVGLNPTAAVYAGISTSRIIIITMLISGALAGLLALNPVIGDQQRLQLNFVNGAGFVGIAVALMGRNHPVGICLAALLFGMLYQGGAELAFDMPQVSREMILVIQGLVILFAGALEHMFRPGLTRAVNMISTPQRRRMVEAGEASR